MEEDTMLSEKTLNDPATYMRQRGFPPTVILECAICPTRFQAKDGMAFPTKTKEGNIVMGAFCSAKCYLAAMPTIACYRA
jgi:hypothetical protein